MHVFMHAFKTFIRQHTFSPHCDTTNSFFFVLFCYFFSSGLIQEWSKSICLTFVHNIWPVVYSAEEQLITNATSAHVFPFTTRSEGTHHPACYYPALSTTMSPFSVGSTRGKNGLLSMNTMRCGQIRSIVEEGVGGKTLKERPSPPPPPNSIKQTT